MEVSSLQHGTSAKKMNTTTAGKRSLLASDHQLHLSSPLLPLLFSGQLHHNKDLLINKEKCTLKNLNHKKRCIQALSVNLYPKTGRIRRLGELVRNPSPAQTTTKF
jgi:hypothetical protein